MTAQFEFMKYENQDKSKRGNATTGRGWPQQTGQKFTSCFYDYSKIHNYSDTMRNALTWPEEQVAQKYKVEDGRDFMTENKD